MSSELTKEDILRLFAETDRRLDRRIAETDRRLDKRFAETDRELKEAFKETDRELKETDKKVKELAGLFTGQWGKLIEALVKPSALKLFQERGVKITVTYQRVESFREGKQKEIDLLLTNDREAVVVEVKTTLRVADVREFLADLSEFSFFFPRYRGVKIYGAVAGLRVEEEADKFAYRQGLFVLSGSGEGLVRILNDAEFRPKNFGTGEGEGEGEK